jgi:hypothetical protein
MQMTSKTKAQRVHTFYNDPGHGWLAVKVADLFLLGIAHKISTYSYMRGLTAYLEEDCDAGIYIEAHKQKYGEFNYVFSVTDKRHWIRSCECYAYRKAEQVHLKVNLGNSSTASPNLK